MKKLTPASTCRQAALVFRARQAKAWSESDRSYYRGIAETFEMFGDAPLPEKFWTIWDPT